jgi:uncharacterized protein (DUF305 family)
MSFEFRWAFVSLLVLACATTRAPAQEHAHGTATAAPTASASSPQLFTQDELLFLSHMIVHHQQAIAMAELVPSRTKRDELIRFARYIDGEQRAEIRQMQGLLDLAKERGLEIPHHEMHGDPPMAGMLSSRQMAELKNASGAEFERLWMQGMIYHHQGGLDMGLAQQKRQFETGRRPYGIDVLAEEIVVVQRAEITQLQGWLNEWKLARRQ